MKPTAPPSRMVQIKLTKPTCIDNLWYNKGQTVVVSRLVGENHDEHGYGKPVDCDDKARSDPPKGSPPKVEKASSTPGKETRKE